MSLSLVVEKELEVEVEVKDDLEIEDHRFVTHETPKPRNPETKRTNERNIELPLLEPPTSTHVSGGASTCCEIIY